MTMTSPRWLAAEDAAAYLSLRIDAFFRLTRAGRIPAPSHFLGDRTGRWDREKLDMVMIGATTSSTDTRSAVHALAEEIKTKKKS